MSRTKLLYMVALVAGVLLSACGTEQTRRLVDVNVALNEFGVQSSVTDFKTGVPYHFTITNKGQIAHEFMIMPAGNEHQGMPGMSMDDHHEIALLVVPEEQLPAGGTVEVDYTFETVPQQAMEIVCRLPGHYEAGMHTPISIGN